MTKARNIADLLDGNGIVNNSKITLDANEIPNLDASKITSGSVASARLGNVPASDDASALTTGTLPNARLPNNISDGGTAGTKVASGTTAQRGSTTGQWRYNETTGFFEGVGASGSVASLAPTPVVTSVDDTNIDSAGGGNQTLVITGENFSAGGVVSFIGNDGSIISSVVTTFNSATQVTAVTAKSNFINSKEPYDIKYVSSGKTGLLENIINVDNSPAWQTTAGTVADVVEGYSINATLSATDPDGDTVSYAETGGTVIASNGMSLNSSTGVITGTAPSVASTNVYGFNVRATANGVTTDRTFNVVNRNLNANTLLLDSNLPCEQNKAVYRSSFNPSTKVNFTNGDIQCPSLGNNGGGIVANASYLYSHYNQSNSKVDHQYASIIGSTASNPGEGILHFGVYQATNSNGVYATFDYGANASFKIRRFTGKANWRTGNATFYLYGSNDVSSLGSGSTFSGTGVTQLQHITNPGATFDTGNFTNNTFYRYYTFRIQASGSSYDWGWYDTAIYGEWW